MSKKEIIKFNDFSFKYSSSKTNILENINLSIESNEITVLAGPTGCGKSTLLRSIVGLIPNMYDGEYSGEVIVDGIRIKDAEIKEIAERVGFVFQNPENQIFMFSVERDIAFGLENLGIEQEIIKERIKKIMETLNITHLAEKAPHELSDGQKQRTALAGVLAMEPKILILDEPTSLLDPKTASEFMELMNKLCRENGISIIIVEDEKIKINTDSPLQSIASVLFLAINANSLCLISSLAANFRSFNDGPLVGSATGGVTRIS